MKLQKETTKRIYLGVVFVATITPILLLLYHIGRFDLAYPVLCSIGSIEIAIWVNRELLGKLWFWTTMLIISALHGYIVLHVQWKEGRVPVQMLFLFMLVDFAVILGILNLVGKVFGAEAPQNTSQE
ncbi:MAG: hypothetical protein ABR905_18035 [Terracidiphilus sp.]|jgi:hypothetical protein